jgi:hypothetical protein
MLWLWMQAPQISIMVSILLQSTGSSFVNGFIFQPHLRFRPSSYSYSYSAAVVPNTSTFLGATGTGEEGKDFVVNVNPNSKSPRIRRDAAEVGSRKRRTPPRSRTSSARRPRQDLGAQISPAVVPFDAKALTEAQDPNHGAPLYALTTQRSEEEEFESPQEHEHEQKEPSYFFEFISLDEMFPGLNFSDLFDSSADFREELRHAMRQDIFYSNPAHGTLSEKVITMLLGDDSSVQGTWRCDVDVDGDAGAASKKQDKMSRLTFVLTNYLGSKAPTGEQVMMKIGGLCSYSGPSSSISSSTLNSQSGRVSGHYIDIVGRKDKTLNHSWHQDTGRSGDAQQDGIYTVLWGFPPTCGYSGTGVYSHMVKLSGPHLAPPDHPNNEPVLFPRLEKILDDKFVVRPLYQKHSELLRFKDTCSLHSAPDVTYRSSVMRFM